MSKKNLQDSFIEFCKQNKFEINNPQIEIISLLDKFVNSKKNILNRIFKTKNKLCFYLFGGVGVGKTMILNFVYNQLNIKKLRLHFNEFMINFHDFIFQIRNKNNGNEIDHFVKNLKKKAQIIYLDEFQVTNVVDAMILGKLFKKIFEENLKVIFSSNINLNNLYKDGLQRDQFIPFLKILEKNCYEKVLFIDEDYRIINDINLKRFLSPVNQSTNFIFNKLFRKITKNKVKSSKMIEIKGRKIILENFYKGIVKFNFDELCNRNLGSEDYINISKYCSFIFIDNLPTFNENNSNQQQRFITLIDILYEKKIPLTIRSEIELKLIKPTKSLEDPFKRTISRLYELTSINYDHL